MANKKSTINKETILSYGAGFGVTFGIVLGSVFGGIGIAFGISIGIILGVTIAMVFGDKIVQLIEKQNNTDSDTKKE